MPIKHSLIALLMTLTGLTVSAQNPDADVYDLTPDQNINTPQVQPKYSQAIVRHIEGLIAYFKKHGLTAEPRRRGEVACIIIEADWLFAPNDTVLSPKAGDILRHMANIAKMPDTYKLVVLGHADDTGDDSYSDYLTEVRANAVDEYLESLIDNGAQPNIIPYGMSYEEPRLKNTSMDNRRQNRRIEIYIIPEKRLIKMAKDGKLN